MSDLTILVDKFVTDPLPFTYTSDKTYLSNTIVYNGYLYVAMKASYDKSRTPSIYRLNLYSLASKWELVSSGYASGLNFIFGGSWNKFYLLGYMNGGQNPVATASIFDVSNPQNGWLDLAISDIPNDHTDYTCSRYGGGVVETESYIFRLTPGLGPTVCTNRHLLISKANLNGSWIPTSAAPYQLCRSAIVVYNNEVYLLGGYRSSSVEWTATMLGVVWTWYTANPSNTTNTALKYNPTTDTWVESSLPDLPAFIYEQGTAVLAGHMLYIMMNASNVHHYIDMRLGSVGTWKSFQAPAFSFNETCSLAYDVVTKRLIAIDTAGYPHYLQLNTDNTPNELCRWDDVPFGRVSSISVTTPVSDFVVSCNSKEIRAASQATSTFTFNTYGWTITSMSNMNTPVGSIEVSSYATGSVNLVVGNDVIGLGKDLTFSLASSSSEIAYTSVFGVNDPYCSFVAKSVASGHVDVVGTPQTIYFETESQASGRIDSITKSVNLINFTIGSHGSGVVPVANKITPNCDVSFQAEGRGVVTLNGVTQYPPATVDAWSVNLKTAGHSQYTNYPFNGLFYLNGVMYGTSSRGLFRFEGSTDDETPIIPIVSSGVTDFGTTKRKNVPSAYVHARVDADVIVQLNTDEQIARRGYRSRYDGFEGLHRRRAKCAKGIRGVDWQVQVTADNPTEFDVNQIELDVTVLGRTI